MKKGQIISGSFGQLLVRKKSDVDVEIGELLVAENNDIKMLFQVFDLQFASQISQQNLELISGMKLEEDVDLEFMEPHLRNYSLVFLKNLITLKEKNAKSSKSMPEFFSEVREVEKEDLDFLTKPTDPMFIGHLRSGAKTIDFPLFLPGRDVFSHHILISGTTGKGKSVLMSNLLWDVTDKDYCSMLVLDPHDEYFGRNKLGLKDHPDKEKLIYYSAHNPPPGQRTLKINLKILKPDHFNFMDFSPPQRQAMNAYFREYGAGWIEAIILEREIKLEFQDTTCAVLKRRFCSLLDLDFSEMQLFCNGVFDMQAGETLVKDIAQALEETKTVIIDTSNFSGTLELLIGSILTTEIFRRYKNYKMNGSLKDKPVISIVLEEAPRVLGKEVLEKGSNIFSTIAREGRKFNVGLTAITQLPSLIPRQILANINTKIILGTEMNSERQAIIESASQDLSEDNRNIASLDKGEAIVTSNFARFALPIKVPFFDDVARAKIEGRDQFSQDFSGLKK